MCFTWISQKKTAIISRYSINRLALVTEKGCVYCAVRAEQFRLTTVFKSRESAQAVSCRSLTVEVRIRFHVSKCDIGGGQSGTG